MKRIVSIIVVMAFILGTFVFVSNSVTSSDFTEEELESSSYEIRKYTEPMWEGNIVYNEIVHPIREQNGDLPAFQLVYDAAEIVSVKDYKLEITYEEGIDYRLADGNLEILPDGNIHIMNYEDMHPTTVPSWYGDDQWSPYYPRKNGDGWEYWTGGADVCSNSIAVTYIHNDTWDGPVPDSQESKLPKTFEKLKNDDDLKIVVAGDSVSVGAMGSGFLGIAPRAESYPEMTVRALKEKYSNDKITLINSAIGGAMTRTYSNDTALTRKKIINHNPDLVVLCFGMNDSSCDRVGISGGVFKADMVKLIDYIREKLPNSEILLVSSLYGNRYTFSPERYEEHAAVLHTISEEYGTGVGVTDPQRVEKYLIEEVGKDYICFTADNMVHPGDFGMRIIAQSIIEALSFEDVSAYRDSMLEKLVDYANIDVRPDDVKREAEEVLSAVTSAAAALDEEWDISELIDDAFETISKLNAPGDVNGDGNVNVADVTLVLKHIAKWNVKINTYAADVNDDGNANVADVTLILKYIAKWDVELK